MARREVKQVGSPRVAPSLGQMDPRARNSARLRLGDGLRLSRDGYIERDDSGEQPAPEAPAVEPTQRSLSTFSPTATPTTAELRDKLNEVVKALVESGLVRQSGGLT